jgi:hypothetical protein
LGLTQVPWPEHWSTALQSAMLQNGPLHPASHWQVFGATQEP